VLSEQRQLEGAVARAGILEVDQPDPAAVPQEVGQVGVAVSQDATLNCLVVTIEGGTVKPVDGARVSARYVLVVTGRRPG
jgi:hypothetical protein